jgi:AGZA family xanthine/uracil permease-like MFS transporter
MSAQASAAPSGGLGGIAAYFKFAERGTDFVTESRAGLTTFMVMAYIIFLNPSILMAGFTSDGVAQNTAFTAAALSAATALIAGIMTIAMGVVGKYPFAIAAGLGINGIVAFTLTLGKGLTPAGAMGVIVWEGLLVTLLVVLGLREAIMNAVPLALKRSIGVGIGLFILFIGFVDGGLIQAGSGTPVAIAFPASPSQFVFVIGLFITIVLWALRIRAALIISIIVTTIVGLIPASLGLDAVTTLPSADNFSVVPSFSTLGQFDLGNVWSLAPLVAVLTIFTIMLTDFFDTMGTVTGVAAEAGLAEEDGSVPGVGRVLLVDSIAAAVGGLAGTSSNTTYIESAAGVAEGGRTGFTSIVTGVLFLFAIFLSPIAGIVPSAATAPALVLVGYLMFTLVKDIPVADLEEGLPALLTIILMPLTYDITVGIGAGFISWVLLKLARGKMSEIHTLVWLVSIAFVIFFLQDWITALLP